MAGITQIAQEKFTNLRKRLDQLGYKQPLTVDCLPLVERLFCDLVWTTESLRRAKDELTSQLKLRAKVEDYVAPYKADNGRLVRENNEMHQQLMVIRQENDEKLRSLKAEYRGLESENQDLKLFNSQCLEKLRQYEEDARRMAEKMIILQEKNFQAVVYTPGGRKKQLPFRRQRMDIDSLVPKHLSENLTDSAPVNAEGRPLTPETLDLVNITSKRCEDLQKQLVQLEEELELSDRKVDNFRYQVTLRDAEIERLRVVSEGGRPLEALTQECTDRQADKLIQQLQMQVDLLQSRNEELESHVVDLTNRQIPTPPIPLIPVSSTGSQTCAAEHTNTSSQTASWDYLVRRAPDDQISLKEIQGLLKQIEDGRCYLTKRINSLTKRERDLIEEFSSFLSTSRNGKRLNDQMDQLKTITRAFEKRMQGLEADRRHWFLEAQKAMAALQQFSQLPGLSTVGRDGRCGRSCTTKPETLFSVCSPKRSRRAITPPPPAVPKSTNRRRASSAELARRINDETLGLELQKTSLERDSYRRMLEHQQNLRLPSTAKRTLMGDFDGTDSELHEVLRERDELRELLDTFERQLLDIQSNVRVLTQERDCLNERLSQANHDLAETRSQLVTLQSGRSRASAGTRSPTTCAKTMLQNMECDRGRLAEALHQMTTERDSLRDRLQELTAKEITEKARLLQRLEETEDRLRSSKRNCSRNEQLIADLSQRIHLLEAERRELLERIDFLVGQSNCEGKLATTEHSLRVVQARLDEVQRGYEKLREESVHMRRTLRQLDQEKDSLQASLDERTEQCAKLERELATREGQLHEQQCTSATFEQRVLRLSETAAQRDTDCQHMGERIALLELELKKITNAHTRSCQELEQTKIDLNTMMHESQSLQSQLNKKSEKEAELSRKLEEQTSEMQRLRNMCSSVEQERTDLLKQYRSIHLELDDRSSLLTRVQSQLSDLQHKNAVQANELSSYKQQCDTLKKELSECHQVVETLETQCGLFTRTSTESEERVRRIQSENEEICRELSEVRNLCDRLERQSHTAQHQATTCNLEANQLRANLAETERELASLRKQVDRERETNRNLEIILSTSRESEFKSQKNIQDCRTELQCARERLDERTKRLAEAENQCHALRNRVVRLEMELNQARMVSQPLRAQLAPETYPYLHSSKTTTKSTRPAEVPQLQLNGVTDTGSCGLVNNDRHESSSDSALDEPSVNRNEMIDEENRHVMNFESRQIESYDHISPTSSVRNSQRNSGSRILNSQHLLTSLSVQTTGPFPDNDLSDDSTPTQIDDSGRPCSGDTLSDTVPSHTAQSISVVL
ncbi:unnamed protein product [Calicophoron daubneyi]|uniref:Centrosomal protein of 135 kDa n=1 Tax=Calicophoron daubneyi TaxID=300641 RepID=A0AAV2TH39_CALDB